MADERQPLLSRRSTIKHHVDATPVYPVIHLIRADVMRFIDTPLSYEALTAPDLTYTLIRPLVEKYTGMQHAGNMSVVFCILVNRVYFQRDATLGTAAISRSRAVLCEILAIQCLRDYGNDVLQLTLAITTNWPLYAGADPVLVARARDDRDEDLEDRIGNAIEMAILCKAKRFIKSSSCQMVIDSIWSGRCVYQAESSHSFISDTYKRTPIHFYDAHKAPLLDHYRLKVPAIRAVLEYLNFIFLFVLFLIAIETNDTDRINLAEGAFMVYALGFCLEKLAAMQEHGIKVYFTGTWNGFDLAFVTIYFIYTSLRLYGVHWSHGWARKAGIDSLALIACLMFPRLAFVTLKDNLMVLSLRAMIVQFLMLMLISTFCFLGFFYALWILGRSKGFAAGQISWWMLDLYFGLDATGFEKATHFHHILGPVLMVTYACLSNTLLLTVLVSILSNTFATINEDAEAEAMYRKAVSTIEGVKSDALFSYQPPVNLLALLIMLPASYVLTPRWFHKVNVFMIRLTSFPILLLIAGYERQAKRTGSTNFSETMESTVESLVDALPRQLTRLSLFDGLVGSDSDIDAVFELQEEYGDSALETEDLVPPTRIEPPLIDPDSKSPGSHLTPLPRVSQDENDADEQGTYQEAPSTEASSNSAIPPRLQLSPPTLRGPLASTSPPRMVPRARAQSMMHMQQPSGQRESNPSQSHDAYGGIVGHNPVSSLIRSGQEVVQAFTSPLAQIFQPLLVDDADYEEAVATATPGSQERDPSHNPLFGNNGISYGPASRRRLSSQAAPPAFQDQAGRLGFPKMRRPSDTSAGSSMNGDSNPRLPISQSPEAISAIQEEPELENSISQLPPQNANAALEQRLGRLEQESQKTQELLHAILDELKKGRDS